MIVRELVTKLGLDSTEATRKALKFDKVAKDMKTTLKRVSIAVAGSSAAMFGFAKTTASSYDQLQKFSDRIGISTEALSKYHAAAEFSRVATQTLDMALQRMTRRVAEAAKGSGEAKDAIAELGLNARELNKQTPDKIFEAVVRAMEHVENQSDRTRLAMRLFDSEGVAVLQMMRGGIKGFESMTAEAEKFGVAVSSKAAAGAVEFNDNMTRMKMILIGLRNEIGEALIPILNESLVRWKDLYIANRAIIRQNLTGVLRSLVAVLRSMWSIVSSAAGGVNNLVQAFGGWERVLRLVLSVLIVLTGMKIATWVIGIAGAIAKAGGALKVLGLILSRLPLVSIMTGIALLIEDIMMWVNGHNSLMGNILGPWDEFKKKIEEVWNVFKNTWGSLKEGFWNFIDKGKNLLGIGGNVDVSGQVAAAGGGLSNVVSMPITENVTVNVPQGTTEEQARVIDGQVRQAVREQFNQQIRFTLNDVPAY